MSASGLVQIDPTEVFSTDLFTGTGSAQTVTNGIDLAGEGGLVWIKGRNAVSDHALIDTVRGGANSLASNNTAVERTDGAYGVTFNSDGFTSTGGNLNVSGRDQVAWTFRKAPRFFDVVTYTGDGLAGRTVGHALNAAPEMMIVKGRDNTGNWPVYHKDLDLGVSPEDYSILLNSTNAESLSLTTWNGAAPDNFQFTLGTDTAVNSNGIDYVAYLFNTLAGVAKVGTYTGSGGANTQVIDCGFTAGARFVVLKRYNSASQSWQVFDTARGITVGNDARLLFNTSAAESVLNWGINPNGAGFEVTGNGLNETGGEWIFYAIA